MTPDKVEAALELMRWLFSDGEPYPSNAITAPEALSVLTEALAERGWRPIESAPRDGTYVLLTDSRCNPCHLIARWKFDRWWGQATPSGKSIIWTDATHWQPLPEPPHDR